MDTRKLATDIFDMIEACTEESRGINLSELEDIIARHQAVDICDKMSMLTAEMFPEPPKTFTPELMTKLRQAEQQLKQHPSRMHQYGNASVDIKPTLPGSAIAECKRRSARDYDFSQSPQINIEWNSQHNVHEVYLSENHTTCCYDVNRFGKVITKSTISNREINNG